MVLPHSTVSPRLLYLYTLLPSISYNIHSFHTTKLLFCHHHHPSILHLLLLYSTPGPHAYFHSLVLTTSFSGMDNVLCCDSTPLVLIVERRHTFIVLYSIAYLFYCYYTRVYIIYVFRHRVLVQEPLMNQHTTLLLPPTKKIFNHIHYIWNISYILKFKKVKILKYQKKYSKLNWYISDYRLPLFPKPRLRIPLS